MEQLYKELRATMEEYYNEMNEDRETDGDMRINLWNTMDGSHWNTMEAIAEEMKVSIGELKEDMIEDIMK